MSKKQPLYEQFLKDRKHHDRIARHAPHSPGYLNFGFVEDKDSERPPVKRLVVAREEVDEG